jgi:integrase/recombinase XerD
MSMRTRAEEYLALRRSLGQKMHHESRMLLDFAERMDRAGQPWITVTAALEWATEPKTATPQYWRHRLSVVRAFARHLNTFDPASEIPPVDGGFQ